MYRVFSFLTATVRSYERKSPLKAKGGQAPSTRLRLRSGFRLRAQTPARRLNLNGAPSGHNSFDSRRILADNFPIFWGDRRTSARAYLGHSSCLRKQIRFAKSDQRVTSPLLEQEVAEKSRFALEESPQAFSTSCGTIRQGTERVRKADSPRTKVREE